MATAEVPAKPLKRLEFVHKSANYLYGYAVAADKLYRRVRTTLPSAFQPTITKVEETVASYAAPTVARAQDAGEKVLYIFDDKVDYVLSSTDKLFNTGKQTVSDSINGTIKIHESNYKLLKDVTSKYYTQVAEFTAWASDKLNPVKGGQAALEALHQGIEKAKAAVDPDQAAKIATDAWTAFASNPYVAKVLETADPVTSLALKQFYNLHDKLVSWTLYKKFIDTGASTLSWASSTTPYKLGAQYVYPLVQPVADPTLDKFNKSKVIQEAVGYWKPTAEAA